MIKLLVVSFLTQILSCTASSEHTPFVAREYMSYDQIHQYLQFIKDKYPEQVALGKLGQTAEGRDIIVLKISTNSYDRVAGVPTILVDAGMVGRDWMATAVAMYLIHQLAIVKENLYMLLNVDWIILPILNPDGYEYSMYMSRQWKKNQANGHICTGVSLNRNFDYLWGNVGSSNNECSQEYAGPRAFSERETEALKNLTLRFRNKIKLYVSLRTYGQMIIYPWASQDEPLDMKHVKAHRDLGEQVAAAMNSVNGSIYKVGQYSTLLHTVSGESIDWMRGVAGIPLNFIIRVNDNETRFSTDSKLIYPVAKELFNGFQLLHKYVQMHWKPPTLIEKRTKQHQ